MYVLHICTYYTCTSLGDHALISVSVLAESAQKDCMFDVSKLGRSVHMRNHVLKVWLGYATHIRYAMHQFLSKATF